MSDFLKQTDPVKGYNNLIKAFKNSKDDPEDIKLDIEWANESFLRFPQYVLSVAEAGMQSKYDPVNERENYISDVEQRDRKRRETHDLMMYSCNYFNRMCDKYNVDRFCPNIPNEDISQANRELIGEFAAYATISIFDQNAGLRDKTKEETMLKSMEKANEVNSVLTPIQDKLIMENDAVEISNSVIETIESNRENELEL